VPGGGTTISGTSGATTGASALTPADGAASISPASSGLSAELSDDSTTHSGRSPCSSATPGRTCCSGRSPRSAAGAPTATSSTASSALVPSPLTNSVAPSGLDAGAGVVSPTTSGPKGATGDACPMSAASSESAASGASHSTPDGGSRSAAEAGRPCHICGSASTRPKLPTPDPP
jgi:hypothetical protein